MFALCVEPKLLQTYMGALMYNTIYNLNAKTTTDFASLLVVSACLGLIHSLEHRSRRYREVAGTSSNQSSLPCSQEYDGVLTGSCVCWHRLPSANGLAFRYRPPGRTASYRLMGRSPTARIDHLPLRVAVPSAGCGLRHTVRWAIFDSIRKSTIFSIRRHLA